MKKLYGERMRVSEYFVYDPRDSSLVGWRLMNSHYDTPLEVEPGNRIWSKELELYVGPWDGVFLGHRDRWLRFYDVHGNLIPTFGEAAQAEADAAAQKATAAEARASAAEAELERLRQELAALRNPPPTAP
jgi:hypothetical protein